jgi:hypothetical protein
MPTAGLPDDYLRFEFFYGDDSDRELLDASLQRAINLLLSHIKAALEVLYQWEVVDYEAEHKTSELEDTRLGTSVWIPLADLGGDFQRRTNHKLPRLFELEVYVVSKDKFSFTLFEDLTEPTDEGPCRYEAIGEAEVQRKFLGFD